MIEDKEEEAETVPDLPETYPPTGAQARSIKESRTLRPSDDCQSVASHVQQENILLINTETLERLMSSERKEREEYRLPLLKLFLSTLVRKRDRRIVLVGWKERQFIT